MKFESYQIEAARFLRKRRKGVLNTGCGTGKTIMALLASRGLRTLVVCPPSLVIKWKNELEILRALPHFSEGEFRVKYVSQYNKKAIAKLSPSSIDCIIIDEAHGVLTWTKAKDLIQLCKKTIYVYFLTATPLIHSPLDMYWILKICGGLSLDKRAFIMKYCAGTLLYHKSNVAIPQGSSNQEEFKKIKDACSYSYFREENIEEKELNLGKSPIKSSASITSFSTEQAILGDFKASDPRVLKFLLKAVKKYKKVVVFFFFTDGGRSLHKKTRKFSYIIDGKTSFPKRYEIIEEFTKSKKESILFLNYKSAGVGLDIDNVKCCIFLDRTWSKKTDYQAYMRLYRFKRKGALKVFYLSYEDEHKTITSLGKDKILQKCY